MAVLGWILVIALFVIGMAGAVYPVLPGVLAVYFAFFVYGWFFSFEPFGWLFWTIQTLIVVALLIADYAVGAWGVKKFGGSKLSVWLSTIGIIVGPFLIPAFGLILGPLLGAMIGELIRGESPKQAFKVGVGSVVGLFSSIVVKIVLQLAMIIIFFIWVISF
ncbi:hypothetical protein J25TS5_36440 [Paenibacillus faecis]|uniref:DUF456 family protein n=1 Tax=Paenibacillus faecis TaxID=862114 RepID=A0A5D0CLR7_9BACL|nr:MULTISPECIES: DUF456 family protein [Paenibacillus]MCA1294941.1 DUF456 family protein [Paenibacillus sp. alder61]TYA10788.1 DUF456 family protein [Paenibacillus faecis]GIO86712.1 hypothetical protein J25TS5_36440 [Paenibacillus faecis]